MKIRVLMLSFCFFNLSIICTAQDADSSYTLTGAAATELMKQLGINNMFEDMKHGASRDACECIDSISIRNKTSEEVSKEIGACINKHIDSYLLTESMGRTLMDTNKIINITLDDQTERKRAYFEMERFLRDSCVSLNKIIAANEKESLNSFSDNEQALAAYYAGQDAYKEKDFKQAARLYEKAVAIDDNFAFAWDNLGLTYRYLKKYDKALAAYQKSLRVSPSGILPLQNIPVVYEHMNKPQLALDAYNKLTKQQPDNPEGYFGKGRILIAHFKKPKPALHSICQAYNIYKRTNNPYRADAEQVMAYIYADMKTNESTKKEFYDILERYKIKIRFAD